MFYSSPEALLLRLLLQANGEGDQDTRSPYLWDPQSLETEAYLQSLEQAWPEDITVEYGSIAPTINKVLNITVEETPSGSLISSLCDRFPGIPQGILDHILSHAKATGLEALAFPEQLLQCVQDLFPRWAIEDLQVIARPYAYAFRSSPSKPQTDPAVEAIEWEQLSDLEQIRLCFQVSKAILNQIH